MAESLVDATDDSPHRLVIFVGPHKSASSSVQEFLVQHATGRPKFRKLKAFQGWRWPLVKNSRVPARKQWARLVYKHLENVEEMHRELKTTLQETLESYANVAVGSEEFDRFGGTPWSHRDGIAAVHQLIDWARQVMKPSQKLHVDIVVNFRSPRQAQWISIWKQLMSLEESFHNRESIAYPQWICQKGHAGSGAMYDEKVWEYLDCVANPLGLTEALLHSLSATRNDQHSDWKVTLIDMGGVARRGLDIAHTSACHVMNLPCTEGWVRGVNRTLVVNPKSRPLEGVSPKQLNELEWLLQQRDCTYQHVLNDYKDEGRLSILYPDSLSWAHCSQRHGVHGASNDFQNTTYLLQAMQSQFGCQPKDAAITNLTRLMEQSRQSIAVSKASTRGDSFILPIDTAGQDWVWLQLFQWALIAFLFTALLQIRKRRQGRV